MKRLNILELHRTINEKNARKNECYDKVLEICHKKIMLATQHKQLKCFFQVPEYICGYPIFDLNNCIKYLLESLKVNGFLVKYFFPKYLYVSWDFDEIQKENNNSQIQVPHTNISQHTKYANKHVQQTQESNRLNNMNMMLTSSLLARTPPSSLNMKSTGKLELNLF